MSKLEKIKSDFWQKNPLSIGDLVQISGEQKKHMEAALTQAIKEGIEAVAYNEKLPERLDEEVRNLPARQELKDLTRSAFSNGWFACWQQIKQNTTKLFNNEI